MAVCTIRSRVKRYHAHQFPSSLSEVIQVNKDDGCWLPYNPREKETEEKKTKKNKK